MKKAAFLDRDGVINKKAPEDAYITRWEDFEFLPGVPEAIALLNRAGFLVIVVTNQRAVDRGLLSLDGLAQIHANMSAELAAAGAHLDAIYFCPHGKEPPCSCRKPAPGMLFTAAAEHHIDLPHSWMIGDSASDREAGFRAGCRTITITPHTPRSQGDPDLFAESLLAAARTILALAKASPYS
jgi:D-glycero-D-manno-heptose 1,7-bisphosphate phosphatase